MNFLDSSFAIGESAKKTGVRYLKQIKQRNTEEFYHENNVAICKINNPHNFLQFQFQEFGFEQDHLKHYAPTDLMQRKTFVCELKKEGLRNTEIAKRIGVVEGTIRKILKELPE